MQEVKTTGEGDETGHKKILAIGEAGSGKTTQFATLQGKKFLYVFDPNCLDSLPKGIDHVDFIPEVTDLHIAARTLHSTDKVQFHDSPLNPEKVEPLTYRNFEEDFQDRWRCRFFDKYDWVGFDSTTTFDEIIMDRILYLAKRPGKHPEEADYTSAMNTFRNVIRSITAVSNVYLTAHMEIQKDRLDHKIGYQPLFVGRNKKRIPLRFSECLVFYKGEAAGSEGEKYMMQVEKSQEYPFIRSTLPRRKGLRGAVDVTLNFSRSLEGQGLGKFISK